MKTTFTLLLLVFVCAANARSHTELAARLNGSQALPPNRSPWVASAWFRLEEGFGPGLYINGFLPFDNFLQCELDFPATNLGHGLYPAEVVAIEFPSFGGTPAPTLRFGLLHYGIPTGPGEPAPIHYSGTLFLNGGQMAQLLSGNAYVRISAFNIYGQHIASGDIRGQIRLTQKLSPPPFIPERTGIFGFVDNSRTGRISSLIIISEGTGAIYQANTDGQGLFKINLIPGKYVIRVLTPTGGVALAGMEVSVFAGGFTFVRLPTNAF